MARGDSPGPRLSHFTRNQVDHRADHHTFRHLREEKHERLKASTSACRPDGPSQCSEYIGVALTVRECVRVLESGEHAS
jgi:hypothetical protein